MRFNFNQQTDPNIDSQTIANFTNAFIAIRPNITNQGDRLKVDHVGNSYIIPITKYQTIKTIQSR